MEKFLLGFILFLLAPFVSAQDYWFPRDTVKGSPKSAIAATSFQNIGLIIGGLDEFGFKRKMYSYSPFQDDWDEEWDRIIIDTKIKSTNSAKLSLQNASFFSPEGLCLYN